MRRQGGAVAEVEGVVMVAVAVGAMAVVVDFTAARMDSMAAALATPARLAETPGTNQAAQEASTNRQIPAIPTTTTTSRLLLRSIISTNHLQTREVLQVPQTSRPTTTNTIQTSRPRNRPSTTKRILCKRTTNRPKSSCRTSKMPRSITMSVTPTTMAVVGAMVTTMAAAAVVPVAVRLRARPPSVLLAAWQSA